MFRFLHWYFLILIPIVSYLFLRRRKSKGLKFSSVELIRRAGLRRTIKHKLGKYFILLGVILLIIGLARPQSGKEVNNIKEEGIDISLVLDLSGSMKSVDFKPSRLEVAKDVIDNFIKKRRSDRISLIVFAGTAYTRVPLTLDHNILRESLHELMTEDVSKGGTAIGMGMSVGINRLKKSESKAKVMILVTDGENNAGKINPQTAANLAQRLGIKVYTIGVGTNKTIIPYKVFGQTRYKRYQGGLDEELLKSIAQKTDGRYFRAKEAEALKRIFKEIDMLEKVEFERNNLYQYQELAFGLIKLGLVLILVGLFLEKFWFIKIP